MTAFFSWYVLISLLGWATFPLAYRLFPALPDRGFTLARAMGLLIWGYIFWLLASLGIAQNDIGGILLALAFIIGLSVWSVANRQSKIVNFFRSNIPLIITTEILFFTAFAFLAFVRSANPELTSTEKPMELAFISAILRSPSFPPQDPWLSGYAISYYYFGYVMTAMLAKLTGIPGSLAHNLMTALVFALGAVGSYGILYNLFPQPAIANRKSQIAKSLLAPLFLLLVSNFGALLEVLHRRGLFWSEDSEFWKWLKNIDRSNLFWSPNTTTFNFWTWLDIKELSSPPLEPFQWLPDRYLWWWRPSRILQDYDMRHNPLEVIDEFPFFSFLLGDLHPHVLAIPFALLAIAAALNIFLGGWRGRINLFGARLHINHEGFLFSALVLGGLAFLNTWDILVAAALIVFAYAFSRAHEEGWNWNRFEDLFLLGLPLGFVSILLYLPFYFGFSSQAGGILPSLMYPSRGAHLWVMWGTLLIPIYACLLYFWLGARLPSNWKLGFSLGLGFVFLLFTLSWAVGIIGYFVQKDFVLGLLDAQGMDIPAFFRATSLRRLSHIGGLFTMLAVLIPALAFLFAHNHKSEPSIVNRQSTIDNQNSATQFILLIVTLGTILIIVPDFVYLRDQFGYRINTVFKFYYQAWILWSLAASFGMAYVLQNLRGWKDMLFRASIGIVVFCGLLYPSLGLMTKTNNFKPVGGYYTLDDFDRIKRENPDEAAAIEWLRAAPNGVVAEAVGDGYSAYARISTYSGLQTVLGWPGHEAQWRGSYEPQGSRREDVTRLYTTSSWEEAQDIVEKYDIRYIYIGSLERVSLPVNEEKFASRLEPVFQQGNVVIYEVP
jgi:YYY domain-containing protein